MLFRSDMGSVIFVNNKLENREGNRIVFPLLRDDEAADGVSGNTRLKGRERELDFRPMYLDAEWYREGVTVTKKTKQSSAVSVMDGAKIVLRRWADRKLENLLIGSLTAVAHVNGFFVPYATATSTQRNTWLTNNVDNVLFGKDRANTSAGDFAASLANVDATNDRMTKEMVSKAKRMAQLRPSQIIEPTDSGEDGVENYVMFMDPYHHRDLSNDAEVKTLTAQADTRGPSNRLWKGGDLMWDGVICKSYARLSKTRYGTGAAGVAVGASFLLGAAALGVCWVERPTPQVDTDDYGFITGAAMEQCLAAGKLMFGTGTADDYDKQIDNGVVTVLAPATADV